MMQVVQSMKVSYRIHSSDVLCHLVHKSFSSYTPFFFFKLNLKIQINSYWISYKVMLRNMEINYGYNQIYLGNAIKI